MTSSALHVGPVKGGRLGSLDAFRGIAVAGMILVNNPGSATDVYPPLQHAAWNGWTAADLIFPFFLFIVGVAITFSIAPRAAARPLVRAQIVRRAALIFALGLFLNGFPLFDWSMLRIPGVLQRIALCYLLACVVRLTLSMPAQAVTAALLLAGYAVALRSTPVAADGPSTNIAASIDRLLLDGHLLHTDWDSEGVLTTLPALSTTLLGVLAGHWLHTARTPTLRCGGLLIAGTILLLLGVGMDRWLPINKTLWTPSFVLFTGGVALDAFAICYWVIDCRGHRAWAMPFVIYGTNAIAAYVLSSLMTKVLLLWRVPLADGSSVAFQQYLFDHAFLRVAPPPAASLLYAVTYVLLWLGITSVLYTQRVFIKV